jgi:hypothetical protein
VHSSLPRTSPSTARSRCLETGSTPRGKAISQTCSRSCTGRRAKSDAFLTGRQTFEDLRSYWPKQLDDASGITKYLNEVRKYVVSSTITDPQWENTTILSGDPVQQVQE